MLPVLTPDTQTHSPRCYLFYLLGSSWIHLLFSPLSLAVFKPQSNFFFDNCNNLLAGLPDPTVAPVINHSPFNNQIFSCHCLPFLLRKKILVWPCCTSLISSHTNCSLTSKNTELSLAPCKSPRFLFVFALLSLNISPQIFPLFEMLFS